MPLKRTKTGGFTLVELLVVIGIIVVVSAMAVPAFVRFQTVAGSKLDAAGRNLFSMLRAAKMYAITYRTDAVVAYTIRPILEDSFDRLPSDVIDGAVIARRLTPDEVVAASLNETEAKVAYTPLLDEYGAIRRFPDGTCLLPPYADPGARSLAPGNGQIRAALGFEEVLLFDLSERTLAEPGRISRLTPLKPYLSADGFPAHIFQASGNMRTSSPLNRFELQVAYRPDELVEERFVAPPGPGDGDGQPVHRNLELFATLGRIRLAEAGE